MFIKGRKQWDTCQEHRVALDWVFDKINLDFKTQIEYVHTKNQLADMLTKGNFTRDEWDHLLRLLNIMNLSMFSCSHFFNRKQSVMSKRAQESTPKEGSAVAKPRPMNSVSRNLLRAKKDLPQDLSDPSSPRNQELDQSCVSSRDRKLTRNIIHNPTMHSQEATRWHSRKLGRRDESSNSARAKKLERGEDPIRKVEVARPQYADLRLSVPWESLQEAAEKLNLAEDAAVIGIEALKTNVLICGLFKSTTMKAAIHLRPNCVENLEVYRNTNFEELENLFDITQKVILDHHLEILNVKTIEWTSPSWTRSTLSHDQVITWTKAKVRVHSELGENVRSFRSESKMGESSNVISTVRFLQKITLCWWRTNWVRVEYFPRTYVIENSPEDPGRLARSKILNLRILKIESSSGQCSMTSFLGLGDEKKWYGTLSCTRERKWDSTAKQVVKRFKQTGHPVFKSISALSRGILKRKKDRDTMHFNADASNAELFFRTIHSANQLSIYAAVSRCGVKSSVWSRMRESWLR